MRMALGVALTAFALAAACSSNAPSLTVGGAAVDATYSCPPGASNAAYNMHATVDLHNPTSSSVSIKSVTAEMTLQATQGTWAEKVGDKYDAGSATFTPASVAAGGNATLNVTIPSACTNGKAGSAGKSYGDYQVTLHIATSAGTFTSTSKNLHRIVAA
jgi:hypothetical protein